jgi:hypothetical protein
MTGVEVVTASDGDKDVVLDILRSASTAGPGNRASTWGREFPDVIRDLHLLATNADTADGI